MCLFKAPKPPKPPDPPPLPKVVAPPPPPPVPAAPKQLQAPGAKPDLRIGTQKSASSSRKRVNSQSLKSGLNVGSDSGGLNI